MDSYQKYLQDLRKQYNDAVEKGKKQKEENALVAAEVNNCKKTLKSLQFENERLAQLQEQQLRLNIKLNDRFMDKLNQLHNFFENVDSDVNDVLTHYASVHTAERMMILQTFQTFKDIPKAYSDEVIMEKTKEVEKKIDEITQVYQEEYASFLRLKNNIRTEDTHGRDANFTTFMTELKMINIRLQLQIEENSRSKSNVSNQQY